MASSRGCYRPCSERFLHMLGSSALISPVRSCLRGPVGSMRRIFRFLTFGYRVGQVASFVGSLVIHKMSSRLSYRCRKRMCLENIKFEINLKYLMEELQNAENRYIDKMDGWVFGAVFQYVQLEPLYVIHLCFQDMNLLKINTLNIQNDMLIII